MTSVSVSQNEYFYEIGVLYYTLFIYLSAK